MNKLLFVGFLLCFGACENHAVTDEKPEERQIFPVATFFAEQIHNVDSLNLPVVKYEHNNSKTDTVAASIEEFKVLANEFTSPGITDALIRKGYKETSFADQSIPSITITYSATSKDLELQRIDIIIQPDPVANDKVQSIYMEKLVHKNDTSILKKLFWKTDRNFQIITSTQVDKLPATFNQLKLSWSYED